MPRWDQWCQEQSPTHFSPSAPPWQCPQGRYTAGTQPGLQSLGCRHSVFSGWSYFFFISFVFNRKMFPAPPTLSWAGFGNHFQMGNNFRGEEQLKLWAILPPAPRPRPWHCPEVGWAGLRPGEEPGWAVETGCRAWLSRGQAMWAPANGVGYYLVPVPGSPLTSHSSSLSLIEALHPAAILQEMPRTHRRTTVGTRRSQVPTVLVRQPSLCNR